MSNNGVINNFLSSFLINYTKVFLFDFALETTKASANLTESCSQSSSVIAVFRKR